MELEWIEIKEEGDTYPKEGHIVLVSDGINYDTAWYLMSSEYIWKKNDVLNDDKLDFNNFVITKWAYFKEVETKPELYTVLADSSFYLSYNSQLINILEQVVRYEFPKIENLNITQLEGKDLVISFNEGQYTKEEVELKLEEVRNYNFDANK